MKNLLTFFDSFILKESKKYDLPYSLFITIFIFPLIIVPFFIFLIAFPSTREIALKLLKENNLIEVLTFIFLLLASILGFIMFFSKPGTKHKPLIMIFIFIFSLGMFFVAMEEIAWGQQLFKFETPDTFKQINAQQELTLHNINSLQGKSEIFRLIFGIGGLIGLSLNRSQSFKYLALPKILLPLLLIITLVTLFDFYADFYAINPNLNKLLYKLSELIEFLIGVSGFLYIFLLYRANQLKYTK